ncbi:MAG: SIS domain-containing protein [Candidatus Poseidoniales archaeon]|nr:MAG: SIS domain-containing protein [Candidatus Poseidoniales archaeon]RCH76925.1 MAG: SIS domain-containing protein [Candidatus Poseidoniales archaeon]|tara:strand:+ start:375 stop:941 length:567 start_codon:yes stop_codon:yes gene_type:complete
MASDFAEFTNNYLDDLKKTLENLPIADISKLYSMVLKASNEGATVHFIGNGGSAATPSHSAGDWSKELGLKTMSHTDNTSSFSAWANDEGYSQVFVGQLSTFAESGDLLIAYSGSGNSENVINGVAYAREVGCTTVAITGNYNGMGGGKIVNLVDLAIVVPSTSMERIEDVQLVINHIIKEAVKSNRE